GDKFEKQKASEAERSRARDVGRASYAKLKEENPQAAEQLRTAAAAQKTGNQQPVRQLVKVSDGENKYVAYDPSTDSVGSDVYVLKPEAQQGVASAAAEGKAVELDGYKMLVQ